MKIYSDFAGRRTRQIIADVFALGAIALWVWFGYTVFTLINNLAVFGVQMEDAGAGFRETMTEVGETLGGVPLIGPGIRLPFDGASAAGGTLEEAGQAQQEAVLQLATTLGIGTAALPILMILIVWLVPRILFIRRAGRAKAVVTADAGLDLLALRALTTQKLSAITKIDADALGAWRRGEPEVVRRLAQLELRSSGVRLKES
jgi:TRAP-type C4-dicarboxylate transport system permease small subunit